ncbi:MAG: T9SS type A sorting domain-containing protein [Phaeodactylibacter sp.]|nr:T9SS type A sorting domain-containing protein [Phaeodactylibacter sp.]
MTNLFTPMQFLLLFLLLSGILQAQNITVTQYGNLYSFDVNPSLIAEDDLVYYRFSDGAHLKSIAYKGADGLMTAKAHRAFQSEGETVGIIAYVAKKGGPLGLVGSTTTTIEPCLNCENPTILSPFELVKLEGSWGLFTDGEELESFLDDIVHPNYTTPEVPWILLNAALRGTENTALEQLEIPIPNDFSIQQVIIEDETGFASFTPTSSNFCKDVVIGDNMVTVNLKDNFVGTANVYVLIAGYPTVLDTYIFTASLQEKEGVVGTDAVALRAANNPHDPNTLLAYEPEFCPEQSHPEPLTFRANFQNLGAGTAENVEVIIDSDASYMDLSSLHIIESSHPVTAVSTLGNQVFIEFAGINLPGLNQEYPYPQILPIEKTKGWVVFSMSLLPCVKVTADAISHTGTVLFECSSCGPNGFEEYTPLNEVLHKNSECTPDPACGKEVPWQVSAEGFDIPGSASDLPFSVQLYPTLVEETLHIALENIESTKPVFLRLVDLNGMTWHETVKIAGDRYAQWSIPTATVPPGVYFLQIQQEEQLQVQKVLKQ